MSYPTIKQISLDIYNSTIVYFNAKQGDTGSRYVEITCTENGKRIIIDGDSSRAYIKFKKPDGTYGLNDAEIMSDGKIKVELTQQMLAMSGRAQFDIILVDAIGEIIFDENSGYVKVTDISLVSTICFYVNVLSSTVNDTLIESSNEFTAFTNAIAGNIALEKEVRDAEKARSDAENLRIEAENKRQDGITGEAFRIANENTRIEAELKRQDNVTGEAYRIANENIRIEAELKRQDNVTGEAYRITNEEKRQDNVTGEAYRIANEEKRQDNITGEAFRIANEEKRQDNITGEAYRIANEKKRQDNITGEAYRIANETERQRIFGKETDSVDDGTMYGVMNSTKQLIEEGNAVIEETQSLLGTKDDSSDVDTLYGIQKALQESVVDGDKAVQRANEAAQKCEDVAAGTGIVFTTDIANNLTTTETGKVLDATQGTELLSMITSLQQIIANMPKVHTGTTDPANTFGNNGDYYLKLLIEE